MTIKRFYKDAAATRVSGGYGVALDGRAVRTPARSELTLPTQPLADAVAAEWAAQAELVEPETMPMMRLASTAIDRVAPQREIVIDEIAGYAQSDLLCYRADTPKALVARQAAVWQPLLDWAALELDAALVVTTGIIPVSQPDDAVAALRRAVAANDDFVLAGLHGLTTTTGSLIVVLAVRNGKIAVAEACAASFLDEEWQAEIWGRDLEAEARRERLRDDIHAIGRYFALLKGYV
ncbi:MAG: ATPase [Alphaproteobacteria bacterium]|nr:ATPase [Alphaproteobacteria bacterium]